MKFSSQECWNRLPFPSQGDLPDLEIKSLSVASPALAGEFFTSWATRETLQFSVIANFKIIFNFPSNLAGEMFALLLFSSIHSSLLWNPLSEVHRAWLFLILFCKPLVAWSHVEVGNKVLSRDGFWRVMSASSDQLKLFLLRLECVSERKMVSAQIHLPYQPSWLGNWMLS